MKYFPFYLAAALICLIGCNSNPTPVAQPTKSNTATDQSNVHDQVRDELKRPFAEPDQIRFALDQLSTARDKIAPLDAETTSFLKSKLNLTDADINELIRPDFTPLDSHLVYQGLFFADAARTLDVQSASPRDKALAALSWVNRHVRLEERDALPDPPALVPQRGNGTALERIYVMAAMCHALELNTVLLGDPEAANNPNKLWGLGIIQGDDILVFDPRLGIALPGNFVELSTNADALKNLANAGYDVNSDRIKSVRLYYGMPLSTLAPRMAMVEKLAPVGTDVAVDAKRLIDWSSKFPLSGWDPKTRGTPIRILSEFILVADGGSDRPVANQPSRRDHYSLTLLPCESFPP